MAGLSEAVRKAMQAKAQEVKDRQQSGTFTPSWNLTGKNAIVAPGDEVIVRFGPRWTIAIVMGEGKAQKLSLNPAYVSGEEQIHVAAWEHWWDTADGKTAHAWCPKSVGGPEAECPICIGAQIQMKDANEDTRKNGKREAAKEVFVFNAVVGNPRKLADGKADFRIMSCPGTIYTQVSDLMTGGAEASFAYGNVGDHAEGYDLKFTRPRSGGNDRWKVAPAPSQSPLYDEKQKAAFVGWPGMLVNIEDMLVKETKTALELFKQYYGRDPEADEMTAGMQQAGGDVPPADGEPETAKGDTNPAPDLVDEFLPAPQAGKKPASPPAPPKAAPTGTRPRTGGRR